MLILFAANAAISYAVGSWIQAQGMRHPELKPNVGGVPTPLLAGGAGLLLALFGGAVGVPLLLAAGVGAATGAVLGGDSLRRVRSGLDRQVDGAIRQQLHQVPPPGPPALPQGYQPYNFASYQAPPAAWGAQQPAPGGGGFWGFLDTVLP